MIDVIKNFILTFLISVGLISAPVGLGAVFQITSAEQTILDRIAVSQAIYLDANSIYFQGHKDWNKKVGYQNKSMSELMDVTDLGIDNPQIKIHQYVAPKGKGYQVFLIYPDGLEKSFGYGVEAATRTWTTPAPVKETLTASST
ncbi:MAG TPA: hypothetical protein ENI23_08875 [bacterium]|nr:hypothetical protein [bacterium]